MHAKEPLASPRKLHLFLQACRAQGDHQVLNLYQGGRGIRLGGKKKKPEKPSNQTPKFRYFLLLSGRLVRKHLSLVYTQTYLFKPCMSMTSYQPLPHSACLIPTDGGLAAWLLPAKGEEGLVQLPQTYNSKTGGVRYICHKDLNDTQSNFHLRSDTSKDFRFRFQKLLQFLGVF